MTVDTVANNPWPNLLCLTAILPPMAGKTPGRIIGGSTFRRVYVVTGRTGHRGRGEKATTLFQQAYLVSVHIRLTGWIHRRGRKISIERLSGDIRERSCKLRASSSVVTKSAQIDLAVAIKSGRVENRWSCPLRRRGLRLCQRDMSLSGPMTNFAGDARDKAVSIVAIGLRVG